MNRLLALVLGILIGSPVCWCCESSAVAAAPEQPSTCCHEAAPVSESSGDSQDHDRCHCAASMVKRDMAPDHAVVPQVTGSLLAIPEWPVTEVLPPAPTTVLASTVLMDESPPGVPTVLYLQHCSLLL